MIVGRLAELHQKWDGINPLSVECWTESLSVLGIVQTNAKEDNQNLFLRNALHCSQASTASLWCVVNAPWSS